MSFLVRVAKWILSEGHEIKRQGGGRWEELWNALMGQGCLGGQRVMIGGH